AEVEPGRAVVMAGMSVPVAQMDPMMKMEVRQMQVQVTEHERQRAQSEADDEADEIKRRPGHDRLLDLAAGTGAATDAAAGPRSTSIRRSARPGFSRISPSRIRHMRESRCLATVTSA